MTNDARTALCNVVLVFPQTEFEQIIYLFEQIRHTYNIYAGSGGRGGECINYSTAENPRGPWTFRGQVTGAAENSFTIHPGVVDYKGHTYLFYHNGKLDPISGAETALHWLSVLGARDGGNAAQPPHVEALVPKQESLRNRWTSQAFKTKWWRK